MKNNFLLLFLLCFLIGCDDQKSTLQETVIQYYKARDAANFKELRKLLSENITITAGDYVMPYNLDSYYDVFRWDSIFRPSYTIVGLQEKNNQIFATVTLKSLRNKFLKNNPMTCQYLISFNSGRISKIEELDCKDANWKIWQKERDSLVGWIKNNHPELDGFIHDMTMNGAINYLEAIKLFESDKKALCNVTIKN